MVMGTMIPIPASLMNISIIWWPLSSYKDETSNASNPRGDKMHELLTIHVTYHKETEHTIY